MECYLRIEGVNLDAILFDTPHISVARGASFLLRKLTQELPKLVKEDMNLGIELKNISIGASIGLYQFGSDTPAIIKTLPDRVLNFLNNDPDYKYFTFVVDAIVSSGKQNFRSDLEALKSTNRYQQMQMPSLSLVDIAISSKTPCACNGILPAKKGTRAGTKEDVAPSIAQRYQQGKDLRQAFYQQEAGEEFTKEGGYHFTDQLDQLSQDPTIKNNLNNKLAVIYLDGNKFGKLQREHCQTKEAQQAFDKKVQDYRSEYLANFLRAIKDNTDYHFQDQEGRRLRLEVLLWGGDEILLVVPAWCGMHALNFFYEQSQNWTFNKTPLTHAGGIAFANHKTPIQRLKKLAKDLAEEVKKASSPETPSNGFDYLILESLNCPTSSLEMVRKQVFGEKVEQSRSLLAPISLADLEASHNIKVMVKSQLYKIAHTIVSEGRQSKEAAEHLGEQAKADIKRMQEVVKRHNEDVVENAQQQMPILFQPFDGSEASREHIWPWLHTIELWDYLPPVEREEKGDH